MSIIEYLQFDFPFIPKQMKNLVTTQKVSEAHIMLYLATLHIYSFNIAALKLYGTRNKN